jgi:class 3 adenylate cyclase
VWEHRPADDAQHALPWRGGEGAIRQAEGPSPALSSPLADLGSHPWEGLDGEHKQVTVLCCALAEAPTLTARLGPEAMYHLLHDVLALAQDTVQRYEGTLTQVSGEGLLALFGAPVRAAPAPARAQCNPWAAARCGGPPGAPHRAAGGGPAGVRAAAALHRGWRYPPSGNTAPAAGSTRHHTRQRRHLRTGKCTRTASDLL